MANRNIQMKKGNGTSWDNMYPVTLDTNVFDENGNNSIKTNQLQLNGENQSKQLKKGIISIVYDDGRIDHYTEAFPIHQTYGLPFTLAIDVRNVFDTAGTGKVTYAQLKEMVKTGLTEIASHSMTHTILDSSKSFVRTKYEILESKKHLQEMGFDVNTFVAPSSMYDSADSNKMELLKELYEVAYINYKDAQTAPVSDLVIPYPYELHSLYRANVSNKTLDEMKAWVDYVEANNAWLTIYAHGVGTSGEITTSDLDTLLSYITTKNIDVLNPADAVTYLTTNHVGNRSMQRVNQKVSTNGKTSSKNLILNPLFFGTSTKPYNWEITNQTNVSAYDVLPGTPGNVFRSTVTNGQITLKQDIPIKYIGITSGLHLSTLAWATNGGKIGLRSVVLTDSNTEMPNTSVYQEFDIDQFQEMLEIPNIISPNGGYYAIRIEITMINNTTTATDFRIQNPQVVFGSKRGSFTYNDSFDPKQAFHLQKNAAQSVPSAQYTKVEFTFPSTDDANIVDNSTFVAKLEGRYFFTANVRFVDAGQYDRLIIAIYRNGEIYASNELRAPSADSTAVNVSAVAVAAPGDTFDVWVYQDTGISASLGQSPYTHFSGFMI